MNTEEEFMQKYDLDITDLRHIEEMLSMGSTFVDVSNAMGILVSDLEDVFEE